ncbi:MAG: hypothetical protein KIS79_17215, partial [Burkholderiales bacterium]|nr:hypothetical protein [Burkholderiales bacterium]
IAPADYAAPFDTVYVSLWKCFNSLNGAILAGPRALLDDMVHTRRMFGGALFNAWPFAVLARHYAEGFVSRLTSAIAVSEAFVRNLPHGLRAQRVPHGTNVFKLSVAQDKAQALREHLYGQDVIVPLPARTAQDTATFLLHVNETWNRVDADTLAARFTRALSA